MTARRWLAPAKLNLFLHITGRRPDGYHELQTLFQLLDYGDTLEFAEGPAGTLALHLSARSRYKSVPMDDNLVLRAAASLKSHALKARSDRELPGVAITLDKQIPPGSGLGGGSADAAITLLALNQLWELDLDRAALAAIGLQLGADVPVFIHGHSAWAEGLGELLQPVDLPPRWYLVLLPDCEVATRRIFSAENLTRNSTPIKIADFLAGRSRNDCESVTCALYPEVAQALDWLGRYAPARMTGTGAAVFASFDAQEAAAAVYREIPVDLQGFIARGMNSLEMGCADH